MRSANRIPSLGICAALFVALLPPLLFAILGQYSRYMADDYCAVAVGRELGAWHGMRYWYENWAGSYANFFLKSLVAPLDSLLPRLTPACIILIWLAAGAWLFQLAWSRLGIQRDKYAMALVASAVMVSASLHAQYSPQSFYWFAASTHFTLPLPLLTLFLALSIWSAGDLSPRRRALSALVGGIICFVSAGMSEVIVAFQVTFASLLALLLWRFDVAAKARPVLAAGCIGTLIAFALQVISPGVAIRQAVDAEIMGLAMRDPAQLFGATLSEAFKHFGHAPAFAGFMLLFSVCLLIAKARHSQSSSEMSAAPRLPRRALGLAWLFQLLWLPLLWSHLSDNAAIFSRFSAGYFSVIAVNALLIAALGSAYLFHARLERHIRQRPAFPRTLLNALLLILCLLFAMTQLRGIHFRAAAFLFSSAVVILLVAGAQLRHALPDRALEELWRSCFIALFIAAVSYLAVIFTALYGRGFVDLRVLAPAAYVFVMPGALLGCYFGAALSRLSRLNNMGAALPARICLTLTLLIGFGICLGQARLLPDFSLYASEWDKRHESIVMQRDSGESEIVVAPLAFDLAQFSRLTTLADDPSNRCARRYYQVDSIRVVSE